MPIQEGLVLVNLRLLWLWRKGWTKGRVPRSRRGRCRQLSWAEKWRGIQFQHVQDIWRGSGGLFMPLLLLLSPPGLLTLPLDGQDTLAHCFGHQLVVCFTYKAQNHLREKGAMSGKFREWKGMLGRFMHCPWPSTRPPQAGSYAAQSGKSQDLCYIFSSLIRIYRRKACWIRTKVHLV